MLGLVRLWVWWLWLGWEADCAAAAAMAVAAAALTCSTSRCCVSIVFLCRMRAVAHTNSRHGTYSSLSVTDSDASGLYDAAVCCLC